MHAGTNVVDNDQDIWPFLSISLMGLLLVAISATFIIITFILIRAKSKVQVELKRCKASVIYDEVGIPPSVIDSNKNIAYISTIKNLSEKPAIL